jgi:uncharacterized protein (DUF4415 family)
MKSAGEISAPGSRAKAVALPSDFWEEAEVFVAPSKATISLRIDSDVLDWFRTQGPGHLTRMNAVLRSYYQAKTKKSVDGGR